jgi:hypothetical protein
MGPSFWNFGRIISTSNGLSADKSYSWPLRSAGTFEESLTFVVAEILGFKGGRELPMNGIIASWEANSEKTSY